MRIALLCVSLAGVAAQAAGKTVYDTVEGPCPSFNEHVKNRGLRDTEGDTHVNTLGWTVCRFRSEMPGKNLTIKRTEGPEGVCLETELMKAVFDFDHAVTVMRWNPGNRPVSAACRAELARIGREVLDHEARHVAACRAIVAEGAKQWGSEPRRLKLCEPREVAKAIDLKGRFMKKVRDELQEQLLRMNKEMDHRSRATHERVGYGTSGINCRLCGD